jgi:APA family basic amino acid/polyamine antiporter
MCITVITIVKVNPKLYQEITILQNRQLQKFIGYIGSVIIVLFLIIHTYKDLTSDVDAWYFHSTFIYLIVMTLASLYFFIRWIKIKRNNKHIFKSLPSE